MTTRRSQRLAGAAALAGVLLLPATVAVAQESMTTGSESSAAQLPAGEHVIQIPGVGSLTVQIDGLGAVDVTALPEGYELAGPVDGEPSEAEFVLVSPDEPGREIEIELSADDTGQLVTEIEDSAVEPSDDADDDADENDDADDDADDDDADENDDADDADGADENDDADDADDADENDEADDADESDDADDADESDDADENDESDDADENDESDS